MSAGYRSPAALWVGGANASSVRVGYRSLLAFWLGGAAAAVATPSPPSVVFGGAVRPPLDHLRDRQDIEDELILLVVVSALSLLH